MKKIDLGQAIGILANLGVIAGILFLAIEIQQNNDLLSAQARATRTQVRLDAYELSVASPDLSRAEVKQQGGEVLTGYERASLMSADRAVLTRWQYVYGEWQAGLIEDADVPTDDWSRVFSNDQILQQVWRAESRASFRPDFVQWMEEIVVVRE
jgi:hypothetical protein